MSRPDHQPLKIARDPEWLAHRFDSATDQVHFIRATRDDHRRATFLTDEFLPGHEKPIGLGCSEAMDEAGPGAPLHFIFHSAYCCSTLLARALDLPGTSFALKEPLILNDICGWRRRGGEAARIARALDCAMTLLARPFEPGETMIIKPSNLVNPFIPVMLAMRPEAHALLLHAPLRAYLGSIARKGMWGRLWVRDLYVKLGQLGILDFGFSNEDMLRLTDLQVAAIGWLGQQRLFAQITERFPGRVRTLDSENLLSKLELSLERLADLFGLDIDPARLASSEAFSRHSKDGAAFGAPERRADQLHSEQVHADEIDKVLVWAERIASAGFALDLPAPLLGGQIRASSAAP